MKFLRTFQALQRPLCLSSRLQINPYFSYPKLFQTSPFATKSSGKGVKRPKGKRTKGGRSTHDKRTRLVRYFLRHPRNPRPLLFSRLRALRHWTIHRAAQLQYHKQRFVQEQELERQYNAMRAAMEELRLGVGDGGKLYRQAIQRQGILGGLKIEQERGLVGNGGIPLEYARGQVDRPSKAGWDHGWVRG